MYGLGDFYILLGCIAAGGFIQIFIGFMDGRGEIFFRFIQLLLVVFGVVSAIFVLRG